MERVAHLSAKWRLYTLAWQNVRGTHMGPAIDSAVNDDSTIRYFRVLLPCHRTFLGVRENTIVHFAVHNSAQVLHAEQSAECKVPTAVACKNPLDFFESPRGSFLQDGEGPKWS